MEKLSPKKKLSMVRLYLSGLSYDEVALKSGVSKGTVANVVTELKAGAFPEAGDTGEQIELLRELSLDLKHAGLLPGQCAVGLAILNRINECGLDAADIDRWPAILKAAGSDEQAKEFINLVYRIQEAQKKSGLTIEEVDEKIHDIEAKAAQLGLVTKQLEERRKKLRELTKQRDDLTPIVDNLNQKYVLLNPRVKSLEKRESELSRRIKEQEDNIKLAEAALAVLSKEREGIIHKADAALAALTKEKQKLLDAGFAAEALAEFNDRARAIATHHQIPITALRERLLHELGVLDKGLGLESLIQSKKAELKKHQQAVVSAGKEQEALKAAIVTLEQQKAALEASIKTTREKVNDELARIAPAARQTIARLAEELRLGNEEMLTEFQHRKDQALEIGKEIGRYEGVVKVNEWLMELLSLARGEDNLEAGRVRVILLQVLHGAHSWMKGTEAKARYVAPAYTTGKLIGELEQWRI